MIAKPTQNSRLLGYLMSGKPITTLVAFTNFGITKCSNRISEIETDTGFTIERKRVKVQTMYGGKVSVMQYSLSKKDLK